MLVLVKYCRFKRMHWFQTVFERDIRELSTIVAWGGGRVEMFCDGKKIHAPPLKCIEKFQTHP